MIIAEVEGQFRDFDIKVDAGEGFADTEIEVLIKIASIDTGNSDRDNHLKSADFFDVENHPEIKFVSTSLEKTDNEEFKLKGDLTIRGITKPVDLDVTFGGQIKDPWGNDRVGFEVKGQLNRFDYDLKWNSLMETGGAIVGKTIKINCRVELTKAE
jgi:polyisoprenoid-binding protein YceI